MPHTNNKFVTLSIISSRIGFSVDADRDKKFTYKSQARAPISNKAAARPPKRVKEALFDDEQRTEYLSGFSKRKQAKKEAAKGRAEEKERLERNELRAAVRSFTTFNLIDD